MVGDGDIVFGDIGPTVGDGLTVIELARIGRRRRRPVADHPAVELDTTEDDDEDDFTVDDSAH